MSEPALQVLAVTGLPEITAGADLTGLIVAAAPWLTDGDILVVSSKALAKAEGRVLATPRADAIESETVAVVARRADTRIVRTASGAVLAAAGVDESNTDPGTVVLLPADPDAGARALRADLQRLTGRRLAVVLSDTAGRPWRTGQVDLALGVAGLEPLLDLRGGVDASGRRLEVTVTAVADALAAAGDLVKGKAAGVPVAVVRGAAAPPVTDDDGPGAATLVRPPAEDLFRYSPHEALLARRTVRAFRPDPVPAEVVERAVAAAGTAPAPHHTRPWRFVQVAPDTATRLLAAMADRWRADLTADGLEPAAVERRIARGAFLHDAPVLLVPCRVLDGAHSYPDARRSTAEERMFTLAVGAAIQTLLVSLTADGVGSAWVSSTLFCPDVARAVLDLPEDFEPMGAIVAGYPVAEPPARPDPDAGAILIQR